MKAMRGLTAGSGPIVATLCWMRGTLASGD